MARVLINNKWYFEVAPAGIYESHYEMFVKTQAKRMWPRFHPVHFKASVYAGSDPGVKADFALVERSYSEWWVVEVELEAHSFEGHVFPQARKLAHAAYGDPEAEKMCEECNDLDLTKTKALLKDHQPNVLVVVNRPKPAWVKKLATINAYVAVFEMFIAGESDYVFRINGVHPVGKSDKISAFRFDPLMRRWMIADTPISFAGITDHQFSIEHDGFTSTWKRFEQEDKLWLDPIGKNPLDDTYDYLLVRRGDGRFSFEKIAKGAQL
jgi:hypothetical protein